MKTKLFIIGNGFDLAHNTIPTRFNPDFKQIAMTYEYDNFWDLYQTRESEIWSDFENLLGYPDLNMLSEIFDGYAPDYFSDRESDRNAIIAQVDLNGYLYEALNEFAVEAENCLEETLPNKLLEDLIDYNGYYITFNYTHTLEKIYDISKSQVLHIHGEVGKNNLILGYPKGNFKPEKFHVDVRMKGRGPYRYDDIYDYIDSIEDYYERTAYEQLLYKCESFSKESNIKLLDEFLQKCTSDIEEIIVYGHSCAIDFDYFEYINMKYINAKWTFYVRGYEQEQDVINLINRYSIRYYRIKKV